MLRKRCPHYGQVGGIHPRGLRFEQRLEEGPEPPECGVVLHNLLLRVPFDPGVDGYGDDDAEGGRVEGDDRRRRRDVAVGCELGDAVCDGYAHETKVVWLGEKPKDVFIVELAAVEGACDVHSALDLDQYVRTGCGSIELSRRYIFGKDRVIRGVDLCYVRRVEKGIPETSLQRPKIVKGVVRLDVGIMKRTRRRRQA